MHVTTSPLDWYAARAGGVVAYVILTVVVSLGMALAGKKRLDRWPRFALEDVHRFGGLLVGSFTALHVGTIAIDGYLPFSPAALVVPFISAYRPLWTALGIVAAELLVAIAVTNRLRDRLPYRFWRRVHYLNFAVWTGATLHGIGSGTDRSSPWLLALFACGVGSVAWLAAGRVLRSRVSAGRLGLTAGGVSVATVLVVAGLALGPLRFHPRPWNASTFHDTLTGRVLRDSGPTRGLVSVAAEGRGDQRVLVRADLLLAPSRVDSTSFQLEFLPSGLLCSGRVSHLENYGFDGECTLPGGSRRFVKARWQASNTSEFAGTIDGHA